MVGVLDTDNVGVLGEPHDQVRVHVETRADGGVRVNEDRKRGLVGELALVSTAVSPSQLPQNSQMRQSSPVSEGRWWADEACNRHGG